MSLLSPGVQVTEIDASTIAPTVSTSVGVFCGNFDKGPVGTYLLISNTDELEEFYGLPNNSNYNSWYQAYNFLQYGNFLYVARATNTAGTSTELSGIVVTADTAIGETTIAITGSTADINVGDKVKFGDVDGPLNDSYHVVSIVDDVSFDIERGLEDDITVLENAKIFDFSQSMNATFEAVDTDAALEAVTDDFEYYSKAVVIENASDFEMLEPSIAFVNSSDSKLKFFGRNPGTWTNDIEIAICTPDTFSTEVPSQAFDGIGLDELFEYAPMNDQVGILVMVDGEIVENFLVSLDSTETDHNKKSMYIETVINNTSSYIFVKENTANTGTIKPYIFKNNDVLGTVITLVNGTTGSLNNADLIDGYDLWSNPEEVAIDIVIANESDAGSSAANLAMSRKDCLAFIGANYGDCVGAKATIATGNLVNWRKSGSLNFSSMFCVSAANYKYQYDKYSGKNRWINIAGDISGLNNLSSAV